MLNWKRSQAFGILLAFADSVSWMNWDDPVGDDTSLDGIYKGTSPGLAAGLTSSFASRIQANRCILRVRPPIPTRGITKITIWTPSEKK